MMQAKRHFSAYQHLEEGNQCLAENNLAAAITAYQQALAIDPGLVQAAYNCGVAHHQLGQLESAIACYMRVLRLRPEMAEAHFNLAHALSELDRTAEAEAAYRAVMRLQPQNAAAAYNLGLLFKSRGQYPEALEAFHTALHIQPGYAEAHNNVGVILRDQNRLDQARACFEKALSLQPDMVEALYNLGIVWLKQGDYPLAVETFKRAGALNPNYAPARWLFHLALPMYYDSEADIQASRDRFALNLDQLTSGTPLHSPQARQHALEGVASFTNFYLQYQGRDDRDLQQQYGAFVVRVMSANCPQWSKPIPMPTVPPGGRIRVGYVSSCMYGHTIGVFLLGWLEKMDHRQFELFGYHVGDRTDALTEKVRTACDHFWHFPGQMPAAANRILSDRLHILVHTDIGMNPATLQLAALRLAPVQCKGWGHPVTTGLPTIDFYLSSQLMEPPGAEQHYSEKLIQLPNLALNYTPPVLTSPPKSRRQLGLPDKATIYLTSQSLFKYLPQHDDIYPRIATEVPDALFVFLAHGEKQVTERFARRLAGAFAAWHLPPRCIFLPRLNHPDFLSLNLVSDVLLDTLEWSGGKTSLEALACDLPVVTLPGRFMRGRHTYAFLTRMGLELTIARTKAEYIRLAVRLGTDKNFHQSVKHHIKNHKHLLFNDTSVIEALASFFNEICRTDRSAGLVTPETGVPTP